MKNSFIHLFILIFFYHTFSVAFALEEKQSVRPGINDTYADPDYQQWLGVFESPRRELYGRRQVIIDALQLRPGMYVADIGAGTGFFSLMMAEKVGREGRVYAVDIAANFVDNILKRAAMHNLTQIEGIVNQPDSSGLEADSIDLAFICDTYHHFEFPRAMMQSLHQSLRTDGEVVIIDFRKIPGYSTPWVMNHVRLDQEKVIQEVEAEGFTLVEEKNILQTNYFLRFRKNSE